MRKIITYLNAASNIASDLIPTSKEHRHVIKLCMALFCCNYYWPRPAALLLGIISVVMMEMTVTLESIQLLELLLLRD